MCHLTRQLVVLGRLVAGGILVNTSNEVVAKGELPYCAADLLQRMAETYDGHCYHCNHCKT